MLNWFERNNKISWTITIFGAIAIFYISSLTFSGGAGQPNILTILYHFFAFFFLAFFLLISLIKGKEKYLIFFLAILISIFYGISDEIHQFFVSGRCCSVFDVAVNTTGILFASMIYFISIKYRNSPNSII